MPIIPKACEACPFLDLKPNIATGGTSWDLFCRHPAFCGERAAGDKKPARIRGCRTPDWCPKENPLNKKPLAWAQGEDGKLHCSHCGGRPVLMRFPGGTRDYGIDPCIAPIVKALNDGDVPTAATCCGHGSEMGNIWLDDGRVLALFSDWDTYYAVYHLAVERGLVKPRQY